MSTETYDPVVCEVDVYLSRRLHDRLRVWQYPLRPAHLSYDSARHLDTRVKPAQGCVELQLAVDTDSSHYARSKGEQMALGVQSAGETLYDGDCVDRQTLAAAGSRPTGQLAVGLYRAGELHLNAVAGCCQLRPAFRHLDTADSQQPAAEEADDEDAKPVTVRFARIESAESKARRLASYRHLQQRRDQEAWVSVRHHPAAAPYASDERSLLLAAASTDHSQFALSGDAYLRRLAPRPAQPGGGVLSRLHEVPLADQVRCLLTAAHVMRTSQLVGLLPPPAAQPAVVLRALQQVAVLVQGCWAVKSDVVYDGDSAAVVARRRARDYVLWRFTRAPLLRLRDVSGVVRVPAAELVDMLAPLARRRARVGWQFACEYDAEFVARHPEVVTRQRMLWDAKLHQLAGALSLPQSDLQGVGSPRRCPSRSTGDEQSDQSGAESDRGGGGGELERELVTFARDCLRSRHVLSGADLRRQLELTLAQREAGDVLGSGVTDRQLEAAARDAGAVHLPGRTARAPALFALLTAGDRLDPLRRVVVDMLRDGGGQLRHAALRAQLERQLEDTPPDADIRKILKDYCYTKGGVWYLKGS